MRGREDKRKGFAFQLMCQKCQGREEKKAPLVYWLHAWARGGREEYVMTVTVLHRHFRINTPQGIFSVVVRYGIGGPLIMSGYLLSVSAFLSIIGVHLIVIVKL